MKKIICLIAMVVLMINHQQALAASQKKIDAKAVEDTIVAANNQLALELYAKLKNTEGNLFFSPYSITTALAMTYEGARGKTAEEMQKVFHFPSDPDWRRPGFKAMQLQLNAANAKYTLSIANALWAQQDYAFLPEYLEIVRNFYDGNATKVDFAKATEQARQTINTWVEEKTHGKIKDLFSKGSLDQMSRLVLTNAIYFKGTWAKQFDKKQTKNEDFRVTASKSVQVPMMRRIGATAKFAYAETDQLQMLEMPYEGDRLSMLVILPKSDDLSSLEAVLSLQALNHWKAQLKEQSVDVLIPKFTFNTKALLNETLASMGMPTAFDRDADFSGMDGTQSLFIQKVIHQAFVDVNEEGTEAAAATGVSMGLKSIALPPLIFRADHPFIFIIQDKINGNILFLGRVSNPA